MVRNYCISYKKWIQNYILAYDFKMKNNLVVKIPHCAKVFSRLSKKATFFINWFRYCNSINTNVSYKIRFSLLRRRFKIMNKFIAYLKK